MEPATEVLPAAAESPAEMTPELSDDDRGKAVVSSNERIATVDEVVGDTIYVEPEWNDAPEGVFEQLQWDRSDDQHKIPASAISGVKDEEILLRDDLL